MDVDIGGLSHTLLYRACDRLMKHRAAIEDPVFGAVTSLFIFQETVTLYGLTQYCSFT